MRKSTVLDQSHSSSKAKDRKCPIDTVLVYQTDKINISMVETLQKHPVTHPHTATKILFIYFFSGNCATSVPSFHIHVPVNDLYIPRIETQYFLQLIRWIGRSIVGIYKSLIEKWIWIWDCGRSVPFLRTKQVKSKDTLHAWNYTEGRPYYERGSASGQPI
jgi:hypothetical protein